MLSDHSLNWIEFNELRIRTWIHADFERNQVSLKTNDHEMAWVLDMTNEPHNLTHRWRSDPYSVLFLFFPLCYYFYFSSHFVVVILVCIPAVSGIYKISRNPRTKHLFLVTKWCVFDFVFFLYLTTKNRSFKTWNRFFPGNFFRLVLLFYTKSIKCQPSIVSVQCSMFIERDTIQRFWFFVIIIETQSQKNTIWI